jgi:uncharacterized protein
MQCFNCGKENIPKVAFCTECGTHLQGERIDYNDENKRYFIQTLVLFLCIVLIICLSLVTDFSLLNHEFLFNSLLILITIIFAILDFERFKKLFRFTFHIKPVVQIIILAPILALVVNFIANHISLLFGLKVGRYFESFELYTSNMYVYGIVFIALAPAIIEELLFRGILFNLLLRFTSPKLTIILTGTLFAFIHFSFFSLPWLAAIGLYLGFLRFRYRTIFYSILFHTLYNGSVYFIQMLD